MTGLCGCINANVAFNLTSLPSRLAGRDGYNFPRVNAAFGEFKLLSMYTRNFRKVRRKLPRALRGTEVKVNLLPC